MFKQNETNLNERDVETIIGPTVRVEGDFIGEGNVIVEGFVNGNLRTIKNLKVGERAKIVADISAANALIAGEVDGNLNVKELLELKRTAKVKGNIKAKIISMECGAIFNGSCVMGEFDDSRHKKDKAVETPNQEVKEKIRS